MDADIERWGALLANLTSKGGFWESRRRGLVVLFSAVSVLKEIFFGKY